MPELSVVVTTYNVAPFIETSLQSLLDARLRDAEIIVVDDGSTDATRRRIEGVARRNPDARIRLVPFARNTEGGVAIAANVGVSMADGALLAFLDGDDWVTPDAFRDAVGALRDSAHDFIIPRHRDFANGTGLTYPAGDDAHRHAARTAPTMEARRKALLRCAPMPWGKIYRRAFVEDEGVTFPEGDFFFEDTVHHWRAVLPARSVGFFDRITHTHRVGHATQTIEGRGRKFLVIFEHYDAIRADLQRRGEAEVYEPDLAHWLAHHLVWCLERMDSGGAYAFFDAAAKRIALHDPAVLDAALIKRNLGARLAGTLAALLAGDRGAFAAIFAQSRFRPEKERKEE